MKRETGINASILTAPVTEMDKYAVVIFRLIAPAGRDRFKETGGGVAFLPDPRPDTWQSQVAELVRLHFKHPLGPCVEVGVATLDRAMIERHCQRHGDLFWQGGDC
jgi:hypothetical protein